ncbi:AraC family transcriptional regulator (plasmid) [Aliisedimentitalea scapharcae]|uniref:AraC family transcriptional regulator n=1 Tax=Aliisedimentitalea scapharcae TaxID=1524259 RepID=A0ABZ2XZ45_9RHOB
MPTEPTQSILFLHPFLDDLKAKGCAPETMAHRLGVNQSELDDPSTLIPANTVYGFLRWSTEWSGEKTLCSQLGMRMAQGEWMPFLPLLAGGLTVWQFFLRFSSSARDQGGSAIYRMEADGQVALWKLTRPSSASSNAEYADATAVGFFVGVLKGALGEMYDKSELLVVTSDKTLIADEVLPTTSVLDGAKGTVLRFPSLWLEATLKAVDPRPNSPAVRLPDVGLVDLVERTRRVVQRNIAVVDFDLTDVAQSLGMPVWKLQSELRATGTSVSEIRNEVRKKIAIESIGTTDIDIAQFASSLGYTSSSNFARAFRKWTGLSPSQFRRGRVT